MTACLQRGSITSLLCGEFGLVYCLEHVFQFGFKSSKLFGKRFVWDFIGLCGLMMYRIFLIRFVHVSCVFSLIEKTHEYFEKLLSDSNCQIELVFREVIESYCRLVQRISRAPDDVGKDGRFQLFVCIGVRCCARRRPRYLHVRCV